MRAPPFTFPLHGGKILGIHEGEGIHGNRPGRAIKQDDGEGIEESGIILSGLTKESMSGNDLDANA